MKFYFIHETVLLFVDVAVILPDCCVGAEKLNPPAEGAELEAVLLPAAALKVKPPVPWPS